MPVISFMFAIRHRRRHADGVPDPDLRHIPNVDRRATHFLDDDVFDIFQRLDQPHAANHVLFVVLLEDISAGIGIVLGDGIEDVV